MANYASLRGPVGMNRRVPRHRRRDEPGGGQAPRSRRAARFASNGPLLGLELDGKRPGDTVTRSAPGKVTYRIALRSPVAVDHLELVHNGQVVKAFALAGDRRTLDAEGELPVEAGGWLLLRAWNDGSDPQVLDLYPYATTSPVYSSSPAALRQRPPTPPISPPGWTA